MRLMMRLLWAQKCYQDNLDFFKKATVVSFLSHTSDSERSLHTLWLSQISAIGCKLTLSAMFFLSSIFLLSIVEIGAMPYQVPLQGLMGGKRTLVLLDNMVILLLSMLQFESSPEHDWLTVTSSAHIRRERNNRTPCFLMVWVVGVILYHIFKLNLRS